MHLKVDHKMPEIHTCDKCGKCLKKKVSLLSHIKVDHENIKDHVCHLCGRGFARQQVTIAFMSKFWYLKPKLFCEEDLQLFHSLWGNLGYYVLLWGTLGNIGELLGIWSNWELWGTLGTLWITLWYLGTFEEL